MEDNTYLSLKEAVQVTGKSIATLRRKKAILEELGAVCSTKGWKVTVEQLSQAGLMKEKSNNKIVKQASTKDNNKKSESILKQEIQTITKIYEQQISDLKLMLESEKLRADKAEKRLEKMMDILAEKYVITKKQKQGLGQVFKR